MEKFDVFRDIAERTGGDIYVGVVGPVRTGKSTFIKRFMELLVLPNIQDPNERQRAIDELPQSSVGRTIMTTEPKFIPEEGVQVVIKENIRLRVRMVDCVGYTVEGALGYQEEEGPRMVRTPWFDYEIPFQEAAETGTRRVLTEHCTIGLVVTTDGSITDIPRANYVPAEERVIREIAELGKPYVVVLNSAHPYEPETVELASSLEAKYDVPVVPVDCLGLTLNDIYLILEQVLYEFPVKEVKVNLPAWVEELEPGHWLRERFEGAIEETVKDIRRLRDVNQAMERLSSLDFVEEAVLSSMDLGSGLAVVDMTARDDQFFLVLGEMCGVSVEGRPGLIRLMRELAFAKREYDRVAGGLREVRQTGYGIVLPQVSDMVFDEPELVRRGNQFGVRLKARAPSLHFIRADIETEVTPIIGTEKQSEELVRYLMDQFQDDPRKIWDSDIFGKPIHDLIREGIQTKLYRMPENAQQKLQETLQRIVNEGSGGLICIII
ncbi:MAG: stage IV sporulation protein A [Acetobacteraceae bacterium]|nr:stage IV sporulation protein A [Acetobacteraceae bacterium]